MFATSNLKLSFADISDFWSLEITESFEEVLAFLEKAWWRGEIKGESAVTRLAVLRSMFKSGREHGATAGIAFVTPDESPRPEGLKLPDGGLQFDKKDLQRPRVVVPSRDPESWNENSCAGAFQQMAELPSLRYYPERSPGFLGCDLVATNSCLSLQSTLVSSLAFGERLSGI